AFGLGIVALKCLATRRQEERIVLAPCRQQRWPMRAEVLLEAGIQCDIALVVTKQIELYFGDSRAAQVIVIERVPVWRYHGRVRHAVRVLPDRGFRPQELSQCFAIGLGIVLPIGTDRIPAVAQAFYVGVAVLGDDCGDALRVFGGKSKAGRSAVVEYVERISI